jgi:uncharacterized iron-regulated membrane protein
MRFKRMVFWAHLSVAIPAAVFIVVMSVTGVLLTYQRQMIASAQQGNHVAAAATVPLSAEALAQAALQISPQAARGTLVFQNDPTAPVTVSLGREGSILLNPYTGAVIADAAAGRADFFHLMEQWHRNLDMGMASSGRSLIGAANLMFLFLVVSGIYIWLPDVWKWPAVRFRLLFDTKPVNSKMRDFNWHHVFSVWALIPLFLIVFSGVVISYGWANNLLFAAFGEQPPQRSGPPGAAPGAPPSVARPPAEMHGGANAAASMDQLLTAARAQAMDWRSISLPLRASGDTVSMSIEKQSNEFRAPRQTLILDASDASVVSLSPLQGGAQTQQSTAQRLRVWLRFVHTGEEYGVIGQTIAGLASLAACFLAYTGLALAYRRLIKPLFRTA